MRASVLAIIGGLLAVSAVTPALAQWGPGHEGFRGSYRGVAPHSRFDHPGWFDRGFRHDGFRGRHFGRGFYAPIGYGFAPYRPYQPYPAIYAPAYEPAYYTPPAPPTRVIIREVIREVPVYYKKYRSTRHHRVVRHQARRDCHCT